MVFKLKFSQSFFLLKGVQQYSHLVRMIYGIMLMVILPLIGAQYHSHHGQGHHGHDIDYHAKAQYKFDYAVHDPHSGDVKSQWEQRDGDKVHGGYTLKESDGSLRHVQYTADKKNGFNAVIKKGHGNHPHIYGHDND